jgi:hypothetical protein
MREFTTMNGRNWSVRLDDGLADASGFQRRVGWEVVLFVTVPPGGTQKIVHRPSGWLDHASLADLEYALAEAESVRTHWQVPPLT